MRSATPDWYTWLVKLTLIIAPNLPSTCRFVRKSLKNAFGKTSYLVSCWVCGLLWGLLETWRTDSGRVLWPGNHFKTWTTEEAESIATDHGSMEIRFVSFRGAGEQGKLGDTEYISIDIFHTGFPHVLFIGRIGEDSERKSAKWVIMWAFVALERECLNKRGRVFLENMDRKIVGVTGVKKPQR